ncbi:UNVERIFIED_CONTAM: Synaptotagmin-5 [Sesamum radiatum]|uniref:Synaptotagmin-5 n=1 Tax=Sesamum radiatum TaxID=300843 RepID=A0AAW2KQF2_SESRA
MGLISGIVMGMMFGIGLMAGWKHMMEYRNKKRLAKAINVKSLSSLNREDLKKICGETFPCWISFPVYEQSRRVASLSNGSTGFDEHDKWRSVSFALEVDFLAEDGVKWLNKQLSKLWPFIADAAEAIIKESVEPLLEDYRPPGISSLKFSELSLGNVAPKIEGIRVQSLKEGQITMDIDLRWGGDPSIILAVGAAVVASIPIQLKDLQVFTVVRAIFQLADEIPCISAVVVALLAEPKPRIDYTLKAVGGSLTAIPGISDMINDTVTSIVTDMLQWPHRIVVPIGGIPVDTSDLELKPVGKLTVTVVKASGLKNMELIGKSDPYVVLHIRPLFKVRTKVIDNNLNPVWNEKFELIAEDKETQSLIFEVFIYSLSGFSGMFGVYDEDIGDDKKLGTVKLPLIDLQPEVSKELELRLLPELDMLKIKDKKDRGTLTIQVFYHEFNKEEQLAAHEEEKRMIEAKKKLKEQGVVGSTMDAVDSAASAVGSGIGTGASIVGSGLGAVGSGLGAFGSGLSRAGKFMGRTINRQSGLPRGSVSNIQVTEENGAAKLHSM